MGKKGDLAAQRRASAFLLKPELLPKLFGTFASRYAERPGGYTRVHKFGNRKGDNAPQAILELVDNPRDVRFDITARAIGWDLLRDRLKKNTPISLINKGAQGTEELVREERGLEPGEKGALRPMTRWNLQKVLKFRDEGATLAISEKATRYVDQLLATPVAFKKLYDESNKQTSMKPRPPKPRAGQAIPGETRSALDLAQGALGHQRPKPKLLSMDSLFGRKYKST
ncbi:hypothetical protein HGRIS_007815 [Hohenbuehelia grisea]|uniref:Uncharacterized protein n=1 Tax=Hohenbuehelia grisea TaxID=104357 RepID=A0ABR3J6E7_9AGAR